ncbi:PDZ domain-containing protein [Tsukamurella soli]|uniref:YlbL family protein n=1 Tax=Tsukamurella soli TaxID=644556 RepID=UPI0031F0A269
MKNRGVIVLVALVPFLVLILVGMTVTVPFVAVGPGATADTLGKYEGKPVITVSGHAVRKPSGELMLTTVSLNDGLNLFEALGFWLSGDHQIAPREEYFPPTQTRKQTDEASREQFVGSEASATVAALQYLSIPTAPGVDSVQVKGPSDGKLQPQDVITAVDGKRITAVADIAADVSAHAPGSTVTLTVAREGATIRVPIVLGARSDDRSKGMLGIEVGPVPADSKLDIGFDVQDIGGPSAGLMLALGLVDMLGPTDLAGGKTIAGTGEISEDGTVSPIGGITHKLLGARRKGATVFLVPDQNCAEAKTDVPKGLELVRVKSLTDAVSSLALVRAGKPAPAC